MNEKKCSKCGEIKPLDQFAKNKTRKGGYTRLCKTCHNAYFREYFSDQDRMCKQVGRVDKNKKEYRNNFRKYKLSIGCQECGYDKCASALHFHHINSSEKKFAISKGVARSVNEIKMKEELDKCILLCANCHAELEEKIQNNNI